MRRLVLIATTVIATAGCAPVPFQLLHPVTPSPAGHVHPSPEEDNGVVLRPFPTVPGAHLATEIGVWHRPSVVGIPPVMGVPRTDMTTP